MAGLSAGDRVPDWTVFEAGQQRRLYELLDLGVPTLVTLGDVSDSTRDTYLPWADRVALHQVTIAAQQDLSSAVLMRKRLIVPPISRHGC